MHPASSPLAISRRMMAALLLGRAPTGMVTKATFEFGFDAFGLFLPGLDRGGELGQPCAVGDPESGGFDDGVERVLGREVVSGRLLAQFLPGDVDEQTEAPVATEHPMQFCEQA